MTRKKVKLTYISDDSSRRTSFKKRKKSLLKKVKELSTLCGLTACAIIYSPYDTNPEVWPSNSGVQRVISEFQSLPEPDRHRRMVDQEAFLRQRLEKATENLKRQRRENRELEMTELMFQCLNGNMGISHINDIMVLNDLGYITEQYLKDVNRRLEILQNSGMEIGESSSTAAAALEGNGLTMELAATTTPAATIYEVGSSSSSVAVADSLNPLQPQQFYHPAVPHVGGYEQPQNLSHNHNQNQQQWLLNHGEQLSNSAQSMTLPFVDDSGHIHLQQQDDHQNRIHGESSTTLDAANSNNTTPATSCPNTTNNIWFR